MNAPTPRGCYRSQLPSVDEAIALVRSRISAVTEQEAISVHRASGCVMARDATALVSLPSCDRSAMDGFAFRHGDGALLRIAGRSLAGRPFQGAVARRTCVAIATGAALPEGCDTVAMREDCRQTADGIVVVAARGAHVRRRGENFESGDVLVTAGTRLDARHLALLSAGGVTNPPVLRRPRIAILSIGDELAGGATDGIHDANRAMLAGFCHRLNLDVTDLGILPDCRESVARTLAEAAACHDAIISSAGTSVGDEDHARGAVLDCGGIPLLAGVAIKPGKPITFSLIGRSLHIALPGNPAAALVTFAVMAAPLLRHLAGAKMAEPPWHPVRACFAHGKKPGLREYMPVTLRAAPNDVPQAMRAGHEGSATLTGLAAGEGLVCIPEDVTQIAPGSQLLYRSFAEMSAP